MESLRQTQLHQYLSATQTLSSPISTHSAPASNNVYGSGAGSSTNGEPRTIQTHNNHKDPMLSEVSSKYMYLIIGLTAAICVG